MRRAGAARIRQDYAVRIAAAFLCLRPDQARAAVEALSQEREAALVTFERSIRGEEAGQRAHEIAAMKSRHRQERAALRRRRQLTRRVPPLGERLHLRQSLTATRPDRRSMPRWRERKSLSIKL
jgi:hypothetical protein